MTEDEQVRLSERLDSFLKEDGVKDSLRELEKRYFADFKLAKTDGELRLAQAKAVVLTDFALELRAVIDRGTTIKNNNVKKPNRLL